MGREPPWETATAAGDVFYKTPITRFGRPGIRTGLAEKVGHAVRGPKHVVVRRGKTPVLTEDQARRLLESIDTSTLVGLRESGADRCDDLCLRAHRERRWRSNGLSAFGASRPLPCVPAKVSYWTDSGRSADAAGMGLHAPIPDLRLARPAGQRGSRVAVDRPLHPMYYDGRLK